VTRPVHSRQPIRETETQVFYFALDGGRTRYDRTTFNSKSSMKWIDQTLSTPGFYFHRHPHGISEVNDGNSLFLTSPLTEPFETFDPRRIGTDLMSFDTIEINPFNYDTLLDRFYSANGEDYSVNIDIVDGEKLYKVSYQVSRAGLLCSYWINPQKGYNLVRSESVSERDDFCHIHVIMLDNFPSQKETVWFPRQIVNEYRHRGIIVKENVILNFVAFDVQGETPFTLAGLGIPIGYRVEYFDGEARYWDGKELVEEIPYTFEPANRKAFWIVNGIGFCLIALWILIKWIQLYRRRSN